MDCKDVGITLKNIDALLTPSFEMCVAYVTPKPTTFCMRILSKFAPCGFFVCLGVLVRDTSEFSVGVVWSESSSVWLTH